jgi:hypothetical protein
VQQETIEISDHAIELAEVFQAPSTCPPAQGSPRTSPAFVIWLHLAREVPLEPYPEVSLLSFLLVRPIEIQWLILNHLMKGYGAIRAIRSI